MATTQYIGARYVPILADPVEWSSEKTYEPLTIVTHEGNSYTSRQFVPKGIDIANEQFWALTGNYNAQVEQYRRETQQAVAQINDWYDDAVAEYANKYNAKAFAFDTVADMQSARNLLYVGAICHTNGFHANGDGGAAWYVISNTGDANGMDVIACGATLRANLVIINTLNVDSLGAFGDNTHDDTEIIKQATKLSSNIEFNPKKTYIISSEISIDKAIKINGNGCSIHAIAAQDRYACFKTSYACDISNFIVFSDESYPFNNGTTYYPNNGYTSNVEFIHASGSNTRVNNINCNKISVFVYLEGKWQDHSERAYVTNSTATRCEFGVAVSAFNDVYIDNCNITFTNNVPLISHTIYLIKTESCHISNSTFSAQSNEHPTDLISLHPSSVSPDVPFINNITFDNCTFIADSTFIVRQYFASNVFYKNCNFTNNYGCIISIENINGDTYFYNCVMKCINTSYNAVFNDVSTQSNLFIIGCTLNVDIDREPLFRSNNYFEIARCNINATRSGNGLFILSGVPRNYASNCEIHDNVIKHDGSLIQFTSEPDTALNIKVYNNVVMKKGNAIANLIYANTLWTLSHKISIFNNTGLGYNNLEQLEIATFTLNNTVNNTIITE